MDKEITHVFLHRCPPLVFPSYSDENLHYVSDAHVILQVPLYFTLAIHRWRGRMKPPCIAPSRSLYTREGRASMTENVRVLPIPPFEQDQC